MKQKPLAVALAALLLLFVSTGIHAAGDEDNDDTDTRLMGAKVVEVAESHISVMARSGVEHVVAVDAAGTKVTMSGETISLKDLRDGDIVTVDLDAKRPVKFATHIAVRSDQVARVRR